MKQGVGKAKHIAGKLLWVQDAVQNKVTHLVQVPTLWNLSDIGTKPLGAKRLHLLLYEIGVARGEGDYAVGTEEFQQQSARHGGGRELAVLAKNVSRLMLVMGLGPTSCLLETGPGRDFFPKQCTGQHQWHQHKCCK